MTPRLRSNADEPIQHEAGAHQGDGDRLIERQRKGNRPHGVRRDGRDDAPLDDRFARARQVERLQIAQPAVNRAEMIERRPAAEIGAIDERHREPALGGVVGDGEAVDAAADDEDVERTADELVQVTLH